jgi:hypothetical protein
MTDPLAARITANIIERERAALTREAQDISAAASRFAQDVELGLACSDHNRLAQAVLQFVIRATRCAARQETSTLYESEQ